MSDEQHTDHCDNQGGQNCIVLRRKCHDWVHEDVIFKAAGLPLRPHCNQPYTEAQEKALMDSMKGYDSVALDK